LKDKVVSLDDDAAQPAYETYYRSQDQVWTSRSLVLREGAGLGDFRGTLPECEKLCEDTQGCNSFAYSRPYGGGAHHCHLKDRVITPNDEVAKTVPVAVFETYYKVEDSTPVPAKQKCCGTASGQPICQPHSPEYDPETEQCCGDGFVAVVCSRNSGCCPSGYTGRPKCFDHSREQCCGQMGSDMPLVCSLDVTCPPNGGFWRQCPAAAAAANAEELNQFLIP